jgi:hypothetical protein
VGWRGPSWIGISGTRQFTTYTFNALFFEEEILATLLGLSEDPLDALPRFLAQGRTALRDAPVVVMMDRDFYRGGKRLPYDLVFHDSGRTFHPKVGLTLHRDHARLHVGSGNLTRGGYGGNAETGVTVDLDYGEDAGLVKQVLAFLQDCGARGEAWERFRTEVDALLGESEDATGSPFLHTADRSVLLDRFLERIPADATIAGISVLAPYHQEDGASPDSSVFERLQTSTEGRWTKSFRFELGLSWEDNPLGRRDHVHTQLHEGEGKLWAWIHGATGARTLTYVVLGEDIPHNRIVRVGGERQRWSKRTLNRLVRDGELWPVGPVRAYGPARLVRRLAKKTRLGLWLHPAAHWSEGQRYVQPLHGKLLAVQTLEDGKKRTHLLVGSANASASALLRSGANVEAAMHLVVKGHARLSKLAPGLIPCPLDQVELLGRTTERKPRPPGRFIEDAVHDAAASTITLRFQEGAPHLTVVYPAPDATVALLDDVPGDVLHVHGISLHPRCSEIEVGLPNGGRTSRVPLRIVQVLALPSEGQLGPLSFDELVLLHAGRYTAAGIAARRVARGDTADDVSDEGLFAGESTPQEVFRALLALVDPLGDPDLSLSGLRADLEGTTGVRAFGDELVKATAKGLTKTEAWLYGQELVRGLRALSLEDDPAAVPKQALLDAAIADLTDALGDLAPTDAWARPLVSFYEESP